MNRVLIALVSLALPAFAVAGVIPPTPRLPQAAADQLPGAKAPAAESADDPVKIAERIAANTKTAGEKLAGQDTGDDTQKTQEQILKDIDALLKQNSPMGGGGGGGGGGQSGDASKGGSGQSGDASKGGSGQSGSQPKPMGGMGTGNSQPMPMGGGGQQPERGTRRERREKEQGGAKGENPQGGPMPMGKEPGGAGGKPMGPMTPAGTGQPGGQGAGTGEGGMGGKATPDLPFDDAIGKQVWGHLPERVRQQMSQYYKEQFMPKYGDLLRQYYSSLAEREKAPRKP